jgi:hypothetical protein
LKPVEAELTFEGNPIIAPVPLVVIATLALGAIKCLANTVSVVGWLLLATLVLPVHIVLRMLGRKGFFVRTGEQGQGRFMIDATSFKKS